MPPAAARRASADLLRRCATSAVGSLSNTTCTYSLGHSCVSGSTAGTGKHRGQCLCQSVNSVDVKHSVHAILDGAPPSSALPTQDNAACGSSVCQQLSATVLLGFVAFGQVAMQVQQPCRADGGTCCCARTRRTFQNLDSMQAAVLLVHRRLPRCLEAGLQQGESTFMLKLVVVLYASCALVPAYAGTALPPGCRRSMTRARRQCAQPSGRRSGLPLWGAPRSPAAGGRPGPRAAGAPSPAPAAPWPPSPAPPWPSAHRQQVKHTTTHAASASTPFY